MHCTCVEGPGLGGGASSTVNGEAEKGAGGGPGGRLGGRSGGRPGERPGGGADEECSVELGSGGGAPLLLS